MPARSAAIEMPCSSQSGRLGRAKRCCPCIRFMDLLAATDHEEISGYSGLLHHAQKCVYGAGRGRAGKEHNFAEARDHRRHRIDPEHQISPGIALCWGGGHQHRAYGGALGRRRAQSGRPSRARVSWQRSPAAQGDANGHELVRARDAQVVRVVDQTSLLVDGRSR